MKKIIESELISIAHRILKLKDKSDIDVLYNESKNIFEKIAVLKFYEDNKFRIDPVISEDIIQNALFVEQEMVQVNVSDNNKESFVSDESMNLDLINELIEDSENSEIISFDEEIDEKPNDFLENVQEKVELFIEDLDIEPALDSSQIISDDFNEEHEVVLTNENLSISEVDFSEIKDDSPVIEIDPIFNMPLEQISFEQVIEENHGFTLDVIPVAEKFSNFENQHLMDNSDTNEIPFHQIPINKTINDAFSHVITLGLNDRIAFEKNLFDGSSEDFNRVISQLNTIESYQEAQDFIDDLVKPDFNYWKGKEEYEERFMQLIQKRFI